MEEETHVRRRRSRLGRAISADASGRYGRRAPLPSASNESRNEFNRQYPTKCLGLAAIYSTYTAPRNAFKSQQDP